MMPDGDVDVRQYLCAPAPAVIPYRWGPVVFKVLGHEPVS